MINGGVSSWEEQELEEADAFPAGHIDRVEEQVHIVSVEEDGPGQGLSEELSETSGIHAITCHISDITDTEPRTFSGHQMADGQQ